MIKVIDRLLLFLFSLAVLIGCVVMLFCAFGWISFDSTKDFAYDVYYVMDTALIFIAVTVILALISIRFLYVSVRRGRSQCAID